MLELKGPLANYCFYGALDLTFASSNCGKRIANKSAPLVDVRQRKAKQIWNSYAHNENSSAILRSTELRQWRVRLWNAGSPH